ncbi:MAG: M48 family metallopeptidase [Polaromonas sp.]
MSKAPLGSAPPAIENVAVHTLDAALPNWRHPQATRQAMLGDQPVAYAFRRSQRRSIGFSVGPEGLAVSAPRWVTLAEIDRAVQGKSAWILKKLHEMHQRQRHLEATRRVWEHGARMPFLGQPVRLVLGCGQRQTCLNSNGADAAQEEATLQLDLPLGAAPELIRQAVQAWMMQQAKTLFVARLDHFAPQLGVQWRSLGLSSARTRWGSASASGAIRLNWRLLHFTPAVIDYVVVHELSHLRVMDHSPRFWAVVAGIVPDHARLRSQLRQAFALPW